MYLQTTMKPLSTLDEGIVQVEHVNQLLFFISFVSINNIIPNKSLNSAFHCDEFKCCFYKNCSFEYGLQVSDAVLSRYLIFGDTSSIV